MIGNSLNTLNIARGKIDANLTILGQRLVGAVWKLLGRARRITTWRSTRPPSSGRGAVIPIRGKTDSLTPARTPRTNPGPTTQMVSSSSRPAPLAPGVTVQLITTTCGQSTPAQLQRPISERPVLLPLPQQTFGLTAVTDPLDFDHGFEASAGYFFFKKLEFYYRMSMVFGQFGKRRSTAGDSTGTRWGIGDSESVAKPTDQQ